MAKLSMRPVPFGLLLCCLAAAAQAADPHVTQRALEAQNNTDPRAWRLLAIEAREAGELELAASAIDRAEELGLPATNAGFERARQQVAADSPQAAIEQLEALVDSGFTAVTAMTGDPVIGTLAGDARFDALVAALEEQAYPCAHRERFREFDFWLGKWDVHLADGTLAGTNYIRAEERGCVLIEEWRSAGGGSGHSINYLDGASGEWVQIWNAAGGSQIDIRGGMTEEGMRLEGRIHYLGSNTTAPFRALWTPLPDGRVRQLFEQSNDGGKSWTMWFEGYYSRHPETG